MSTRISGLPLHPGVLEGEVIARGTDQVNGQKGTRVRGDPEGGRCPAGSEPPTPRLGRLAGAMSVAGGRRSPAGGPAGRVAAESRAARPLGPAPGGMAGTVGVVNRCGPDRRELARMPVLFQ